MRCGTRRVRSELRLGGRSARLARPMRPDRRDQPAERALERVHRILEAPDGGARLRRVPHGHLENVGEFAHVEEERRARAGLEAVSVPRATAG